MSALSVVHLPSGIVDGEDDPLIPEGTYRAVYTRHDTVTMRMFGDAPKLYLRLRIVDPGAAFGLVLYRSYRVKRLTSKPGRNGSFRLAKRSDLYITLCRLTAEKLRPDRISLRELLRGHVIVVRVRTVKVDYKQRPLPPALHYSVVDDLLATDTSRPAQSPALSSEQ